MEEGVYITPDSIDVREWTPFSFLCRGPLNSQMTAVFKQTGLPLDGDPRFEVSGFGTPNVQVFAPQGLRAIDDTEIE